MLLRHVGALLLLACAFLAAACVKPVVSSDSLHDVASFIDGISD